MKIGVVGTRSFTDYDLMTRTINRVRKMFDERDITIVSGGAPGADSLAEVYSKEIMGKEPIVFPPDKERYGVPAAFKRRNQQIIDESQFIVAFWNGASRGTHDSMNKATRAGKPILVVPF